ncbi:hypothetical protein HPB50_002386 [Hyalomma asiaticum]|uniref:Uncharacterized protein n=1 Tax=Hyalomma asiaticum TaxID=266040 RepID=A0ACB7TDQ7_HYAAI|nr:hypothetical protein HPB50_002386 [Hyalomma asiaticum]
MPCSVTLLSSLGMLADAWDAVTSTTIRNCFQHAFRIPGCSSAASPDSLQTEDDDESQVLSALKAHNIAADLDDYAGTDDNLCVCREDTLEDLVAEVLPAQNSSESEEDSEVENVTTVQAFHYIAKGQPTTLVDAFTCCKPSSTTNATNTSLPMPVEPCKPSEQLSEASNIEQASIPSNTKKEDSYIESNNNFGAETRERIIWSIDWTRPLNLRRTMEILKKKRRVIRAQATCIINEADDILAKEAPAPDIVAKQLSDVNAAVEPHIIDDDADAEFEQVMEYDDKIASCLGSIKSIGKGLMDGAQIGNLAAARTTAQRFGNPTALIQDHMQGLIDLKPVTSPRNVRELRRLYDDLQVHIRGLNALGVGEDSYNTMLYPMLL